MTDCDPAFVLSVPEVAAKLRVKADVVRDWIRRGELIGVNVASRAGRRPRWRVASVELDRFLRARQSAPLPRMQRQRQVKEEQVFFRRGRPVMSL